MVVLLGKLLRHGTTEANGSRISVAQYMRDNVVEILGIESPGWMTIANKCTLYSHTSLRRLPLNSMYYT